MEVKRKKKFILISQRCKDCGHKMTAALTKLETKTVSCLCGEIHTLKGY